MFHYAKNMTCEYRENVRGGVGNLPFEHLFSAEELGGRAQMLAKVTLQPGQSIGEHPHVGNGEVYWVLSGAVMVAEDGVERELHAGDAEFCADGHTHAIRNHTTEPATFLALILPDR